MGFTQDQGVGPADSVEMPVNWRMGRPWGTLIMPGILVILTLFTIFRGGAQDYVLQLGTLVVVLLTVYSYPNLSKRNHGLIAFEQATLVLKRQTPLKKTSRWQSYLLYAAFLVVLIADSFLGRGLQNILLSLAWFLPFLFLIVYVNYSVRRSGRSGELRFARQETRYTLLSQASLRIKTKVKIPRFGYSKMSLELAFDNPSDLELFCQELKKLA